MMPAISQEVRSYAARTHARRVTRKTRGFAGALLVSAALWTALIAAITLLPVMVPVLIGAGLITAGVAILDLVNGGLTAHEERR